MPHKLTAAWGQNAAKQHLELFRHAFDFFFCNLLESNHFLWSARPVEFLWLIVVHLDIKLDCLAWFTTSLCYFVVWKAVFHSNLIISRLLMISFENILILFHVRPVSAYLIILIVIPFVRLVSVLHSVISQKSYKFFWKSLSCYVLTHLSVLTIYDKVCYVWSNILGNPRHFIETLRWPGHFSSFKET